MLLSEAFDLYRTDYMEQKVQAIRIIETHEKVKRTLIQAVGDIDVENFGLEEFKQWRKESAGKRCINTIRNDIVRIRSVLKYLELRDIPCLKSALLPVPKRVDTVPTYLTASEVSEMIAYAHSVRNRFVISLLYSSGIRLSEFISLNRGQIQHRRFTVIGKGGKARLCFIDKRTETLMSEYLSKRDDSCSALVVSHLNRQRMTPTNVQLLIKNSARRAGISKNVTPHSLRHSFATNFLQNNGNVRYCQEMLGHASLETTMRYTHVTNLELEQQYNQFHTI